MKHIPILVLAWLLYFFLSLPLVLVGFPLIALLAALPNTMGRRESIHYKDGRAVLVWSNRTINDIWGNDEDGIDGLPWVSLTDPNKTIQKRQLWWYEATMGYSYWWRIVLWSAWRNSTANLRFGRLGLLINPQLVKFETMARTDGSPLYSITWQGFKGSVRWYWSKTRSTWIGWKVKPEDARQPGHMLPLTDTRAPGVGVAFQLYTGV